MWDSLQSKRMYEPMGAFEYAHNIRKKNIGDHIDFLADIAGTFYGGRFIKSNGMYVLIRLMVFVKLNFVLICVSVNLEENMAGSHGKERRSDFVIVEKCQVKLELRRHPKLMAVELDPKRLQLNLRQIKLHQNLIMETDREMGIRIETDMEMETKKCKKHNCQ